MLRAFVWHKNPSCTAPKANLSGPNGSLQPKETHKIDDSKFICKLLTRSLVMHKYRSHVALCVLHCCFFVCYVVFDAYHCSSHDRARGEPAKIQRERRKKEKGLKEGTNAGTKRKNKCRICILTGHNAYPNKVI
jgi:hypothetical protein